MISPLTPLTIPFKVFPSIKSESELIKGTPGIRNSTEVAKAFSGECPIFSLIDNPATIAAAKEAKKIDM